MTKVPGVFAGGDVEHGPRTAVEAIRSGKIAADAIDAWLRGAPMDDATGTAGAPRRRRFPCRSWRGDRTHLPRAVMPERSVEEVLGQGNYVQIEEGLTDAMAHDEARRCLRCDVCIGCGLCMAACSEMGIDALRMADTDGRPARLLRLHPARGAMHRLRRLHAGLPDRRDPPRGRGRPARRRRAGGTTDPCGARSSPEPSCANSRC